MTPVDIAMLAVLALTPVAGVALAIYLLRRQRALEAEWKSFQERRKELYAQLANPSSIEEDFERSARLTESRSTAPREDAGPPAKVYRPALRGVKPGSWRPRNPGSPN